MLFGDTWFAPVQGCQYPGDSNNDLQGTLPARRPARFQPGPPELPAEQATPSCDLLEYGFEDERDVTSWQRTRLFKRGSPRRPEDSIDLGGLRTPIAAFSDGERMLALFERFDPAQCSTSAECPSGMQCSTDPGYKGTPLGACERLVKLTPDPPPDHCRDDADCVRFTKCKPAEQGVCLASAPFEIDTPNGRVSPSWYRDDPKQAVANLIYVAAAIWPDHPGDYTTIASFATNRFQNAAVRTIAYFDPKHPENADYRPGYHTLLMWGRQSYVTSEGNQALPFLLYVPLDELRGAPEQAVWKPRFFAGYDDDGNPAWSEHESDARPIYGAHDSDVQAQGNQLQWAEPESDLVAQLSLSWVAPLSRWVMLYGGDMPAFMVIEARSGKAYKQVNLPWSAGSIHMRSAPHPWGPARLTPRRAGTPRQALGPGWSSAEPLLSRETIAPYMGCSSTDPGTPPGCRPPSDQSRTAKLLGALASAVSAPKTGPFSDVAGSCINGELSLWAQDHLSGDTIGRLYAPNIIDEWTQEVTDDAQRARSQRSAEIYWNVSTWIPYQVVLVKSRLTAREDAAPQVEQGAMFVRTN